MDTQYIIDQLTLDKQVVSVLLRIETPDAQQWRPSADHWCMLEVVCHLVDEEVDDFRTRVKAALNPEQHSFTPIDPEGWVKARQYMQQDYQSKLQEWLSERDKSIAWLNSLQQPNWNSCLVHDILGPMTAGQLLANWLAHDYMHIRQILRIKHAYLAKSSDQDLSYAGKW